MIATQNSPKAGGSADSALLSGGLSIADCPQGTSFLMDWALSSVLGVLEHRSGYFSSVIQGKNGERQYLCDRQCLGQGVRMLAQAQTSPRRKCGSQDSVGCRPHLPL